MKNTADEFRFHKVVFVPLLDIAADGKEEDRRKGLWDIKLSRTASGSRRKKKPLHLVVFRLRRPKHG